MCKEVVVPCLAEHGKLIADAVPRTAAMLDLGCCPAASPSFAAALPGPQDEGAEETMPNEIEDDVKDVDLKNNKSGIIYARKDQLKEYSGAPWKRCCGKMGRLCGLCVKKNPCTKVMRPKLHKALQPPLRFRHTP